jgi:hypothetical protein
LAAVGGGVVGGAVTGGGTAGFAPAALFDASLPGCWNVALMLKRINSPVVAGPASV